MSVCQQMSGLKRWSQGFAEDKIVSGQVHEVEISLEGKGVLVRAESDSETGVPGTAECWEPSARTMALVAVGGGKSARAAY